MMRYPSIFRVKQSVCTLLVLAMTLSLLPVSVFATGTQETPAPEAETAVTEPTVTEEPAAEATLQTFRFENDFVWATVTAEASGGSIEYVYDDVPEVTGILDEYFFAFDIALTDPAEDSDIVVTLAMDEWMDPEVTVLYYVDPYGVRERIFNFEFVTDETGLPAITFYAEKLGRYAYGNALSEIPADSAPTELKVYYQGEDTFFVQDEQDEALLEQIKSNLTVIAAYADGASTIEKVLSADEYELDVDMTEAGYQKATVTHTINMGTAKCRFPLYFCPQESGDNRYGVTVSTDSPCITGVAIRRVKSPNYGLTLLLKNSVAYDITPTYVDGMEMTGTATVTLPIPYGVTTPAVYHISDDGRNITRMQAEDNGDGTVSFVTDHFSVFEVGDGTEIEVPDPVESTVTTEASGEKSFYILTDQLAAGNQYLLVSSNAAGSGYALVEDTNAGKVVTINPAGDGTSAPNAPYIETTDETIMWNAGRGVTLQSENGGFYLRSNNSSPTFSTTASTDWSYDTAKDSLYYYGKTTSNNGNSRYNQLYFNSDQTRWSIFRNKDEVSNNYHTYLYVLKTMDVTTTIDSTYSIAGSPGSVVEIVGQGGHTVTLGATLTFESTTTDVSTSATYSLVDGGDPNGVITGLAGNTVTLSGNAGAALIRVSYPINDANASSPYVDNYILVTVVVPEYSLFITKDGVVLGDTYTANNITNGSTLQLAAQLYEENSQTSEYPDDVVWEITDGSDVATIDQTGKLTFRGTEGDVDITVSYSFGGKTYEAYLTVNAYDDNYIRPGDSTTDFPVWGQPGSVRYNKTATAVGNFSQTGITQLELSMAGISAGNSGLDVVITLDRSTSMTDSRIEATVDATLAFLASLYTNDGVFDAKNDVRLYIGYYQGDTVHDLTTNEEEGFQLIGTAEEYTNLCNHISSTYTRQSSEHGTDWHAALKKSYDLLNAANDAAGYDRLQFAIMMSDGAPYNYCPLNAPSTTVAPGQLDWVDNDGRNNSYQYEYWSTQMKGMGVTVYSVLLGETDTQPQFLMNDVSGPAGEEQNDFDTGSAMSKKYTGTTFDDITKDHFFFSVDDTNASKLSSVFSTIATEIKAAASFVEVEDTMGEDYEMIFSLPAGVTGVPQGQEFYIEVVSYALTKDTHERSGNPTVLERIYLTESTSGRLSVSAYVSIAPDGTQTALATALTYAAVDVAGGERGFFRQDGSYDETGNSGYKLVSGITVSGTSANVIIHTPYFSYNASSKKLQWHITELAGDTEIALRYFLFLSDSLDKDFESGTYVTNDEATLTYKNYQDNVCQQEFPKPQLTWNGAQVSYVFYLVNSEGNPVNRAGREVTFAEAVFVTELFTESAIWEGTSAMASLDVNWLAKNILPASYHVYDENAGFNLHVYPAETETLKNSFTISGSNDKRSTTMVYNTKEGTKYSAYGTYTSANTTGVDFANTTVAFAVVWEKRLTDDVVVIDYGLPVDINVTSNDFVYNYVTAIGTIAPRDSSNAEIARNTGTYEQSKLSFEAGETMSVGGHSATIVNENTIRFNLDGMSFTQPITFYYETKTEFYEDGTMIPSYMYASVTVIPASAIYYEDDFVSFTDSTAASGSVGTWQTMGTTGTKTQQADRPGTAAENAGAPDFDNLYGYDPAYGSYTQYSLGSARKVTVNAASGRPDTAPSASFTFTGTGFDLISLTDSDSGTIVVTVTGNGQTYRKTVDNYYGYTLSHDGEGNPIWTVNPSASGTIWQVPVIKMDGLSYGTYTVTVQLAYLETLDHQGDGKYSFWLDAVRVYDPALTNVEAAAAHTRDAENAPDYVTLRDVLVNAGSLNAPDSTQLGVVFIDGNSSTTDITDYANPGPNHETYLAGGQGVAFKLVADQKPSAVHLGVKLANGNSATLKLGTGNLVTVGTATDMYYDLGKKLNWTQNNTQWESDPIVLSNSGSGVISLTNLKATGGAKWNLSAASAAALADEGSTYSIMPVTDEETVQYATFTMRKLYSGPKPGFADVSAGAWYANAVNYVTGKGLMVGTGTSFLPLGKVSRAQVVQTLYSMSGKPAFAGATPFSDVAGDSWYAAAVNWAAAQGFAAGSGSGTFAPDANVTREQLAVFLYAYSAAPQASADLSCFTDGAQVSPWAIDAVQWAVSRGLISGKSGNLLDPQGTATRAELAQILMNFDKG